MIVNVKILKFKIKILFWKKEGDEDWKYKE